jgi:hypothetical protein
VKIRLDHQRRPVPWEQLLFKFLSGNFVGVSMTTLKQGQCSADLFTTTSQLERIILYSILTRINGSTFNSIATFQVDPVASDGTVGGSRKSVGVNLRSSASSDCSALEL